MKKIYLKIVGQKAKYKKNISIPNFKITINNNLAINELIINSKKYERKEILKGELNEQMPDFI